MDRCREEHEVNRTLLDKSPGSVFKISPEPGLGFKQITSGDKSHVNIWKIKCSFIVLGVIEEYVINGIPVLTIIRNHNTILDTSILSIGNSKKGRYYLF